MKIRVVKYNTNVTEPPFKFDLLGEFELPDNSDENNDMGEKFFCMLQDGCRRLGRKMQFYCLSKIEGYKYDVIVLLTSQEWPFCQYGKFKCYCSH